MQVVLTVETRQAVRNKIHLRAGQFARVGRSDWADFCLADDPSLEEVHFEIRCEPTAIHIRKLVAGASLTVNGTEVENDTLHDGDEIRAGQTSFHVRFMGEWTQPAVAEIPAEATSPAAPPAQQPRLAEVCRYVNAGDVAIQVAARVDSPETLLERLSQAEDFLPAIRLRAHWLPKREGVAWGCAAVRRVWQGDLPPEQAAAVAAAETWAADPSETHRRAAGEQAESLQNTGIGAMLALAAFWNSGSLVDPESAVVEADERLTGQMVAGALTLAAYRGDPALAPQRFREFLRMGKQITDGQLTLKDLIG